MNRRALISMLFVVTGLRSEAAPDASANDFFEKNVRPVLVEKCFSCHSSKKSEAGLRLDARSLVLKGGDSGPVVVPGQPEKSKLIQAIRHQGNLAMPPKGKLNPHEIQSLERWVSLGVPYPGGAPVASGPDPKKHWSFQPVQLPKLPGLVHQTRSKNPIDLFVLSQLEQQQLTLSPEADKRALLRRLYFDLIGLPPTAAELEAFVHDRDENAYVRVVDKLLASPQYGETQARHWLDLARYADTKGYVFQEARDYPYAYTYRDWVIQALNSDMPYDQFIIYQLAADRLPGVERGQLAAMGFLTVGRRFLNNIHDIIDDRMDVTSRTFLGLTLGCARCHDHKFDPIPARDYYSLYGVFASSIEPKELPIIGDVPQSEAYKKYLGEVRQLEAELGAATQKHFSAKLLKFRSGDAITAQLLALHELWKKNPDQIHAYHREHELNAYLHRRWLLFLNQQAKAKNPPFLLVRQLLELDDADFMKKALPIIEQTVKNPETQLISKALAQRLLEHRPVSFKDVAREWGAYLSPGAPLDATGSEIQRQARSMIAGANGPLDPPAAEAESLFDRADRDQLLIVHKKLERFKNNSPFAPPRAMVLNDSSNLFNPYVFLRGNPGNHGAVVPRQFLEILSGPQRKPFVNGSGRLELARLIADPGNPLTARVMVNRIWMSHFGKGLVRTPSDFGTRGEPPTHPELLDWLAHTFVAEGWSIKKMHRLIVTSATYQQASTISPEMARRDPDNRWLARQNRRRLEFEQLRDAMLAVSGELDLTLSGKAVDLFREPFSHRRSIYGFIDRQNLPGTYRIFDFASPDSHSPQRFTTTVPQQALFMMNGSFVQQRAEALIGKLNPHEAVRPRIVQLMRMIDGREPTNAELELAIAFLQSNSLEKATVVRPQWQYGYGSYNERNKRVENFRLLPHWTGQSWQGGATVPDATTGWVILNALGGHPGNDARHAAIRRWIAPKDGPISITGKLKHMSNKGDGIRGRVVSSRQGDLGTWKLLDQSTTTDLKVAVHKDETIDFVVDCLTKPDFDSFTWEAVITQQGAQWVSTNDFSSSAPPPSPMKKWEQFAQILLLSNEFSFVD